RVRRVVHLAEREGVPRLREEEVALDEEVLERVRRGVADALADPVLQRKIRGLWPRPAPPAAILDQGFGELELHRGAVVGQVPAGPRRDHRDRARRVEAEEPDAGELTVLVHIRADVELMEVGYPWYTR